jgi:hypothetical protein
MDNVYQFSSYQKKNQVSELSEDERLEEAILERQLEIDKKIIQFINDSEIRPNSVILFSMNQFYTLLQFLKPQNPESDPAMAARFSHTQLLMEEIFDVVVATMVNEEKGKPEKND